MRSPVGPALVILSLATTVVLVLVLLQTTGLRGDLDRARAEVVTLRAEVVTLREQVEGLERGVPISELSMRLAELENDIQAWVVAFSDDLSPTGGAESGETASNREVLSRLDDVLDRIDALDERVDEICRNVPVC